MPPSLPNPLLQPPFFLFHLLLICFFSSFSKSLFIFSWPEVITAAPQLHRQNELFTLGHLPLAAVASLSSPIEPSVSSHTVTKTQPSATQSPPGPAHPDSHPASCAPPKTPQLHQSCSSYNPLFSALSSGSLLQFGFPAQRWEIHLIHWRF